MNKKRRLNVLPIIGIVGVTTYFILIDKTGGAFESTPEIFFAFDALQVIYIGFCLMGITIPLRKKTQVLTVTNVLIQFFLIATLYFLKQLMGDGHNFTCRDCQGAAGILLLFLFGAFALMSILAILEIITMVFIWKDRGANNKS